MKKIGDVSRNDLEELVARYQGFVWAYRGSFMNDNLCEVLVAETEEAGGILEDLLVQYDVVQDCLDSIMVAEDNILGTGWLMSEIERGLADGAP